MWFTLLRLQVHWPLLRNDSSSVKPPSEILFLDIGFSALNIPSGSFLYLPILSPLCSCFSWNLWAFCKSCLKSCQPDANITLTLGSVPFDWFLSLVIGHILLLFTTSDFCLDAKHYKCLLLSCWIWLSSAKQGWHLFWQEVKLLENQPDTLESCFNLGEGRSRIAFTLRIFYP